MKDIIKSLAKNIIHIPISWIIVISIAAFAVAYCRGTEIVPFWDSISSPEGVHYGIYVDKVATLVYGGVGVSIIYRGWQDGKHALSKKSTLLFWSLYPSLLYRGIKTLMGKNMFDNITIAQTSYLIVVCIIVALEEYRLQHTKDHSEISNMNETLYFVVLLFFTTICMSLLFCMVTLAIL